MEEGPVSTTLSTYGYVLGLQFVGLPFDVVKLRLQTQGRDRMYKGITDAFVLIAKEEGIRALGKGGTPSLTAAVLPLSAKAVTTGVAARTVLMLQLGKQGREDENTLQGALEGGIGSLFATTIAAVPENIKSKLQFQRGPPGQGGFRGPLDCMSKVFKREGARGLFRGYSALLLRDVAVVAVAVGASHTTKPLVTALAGPNSDFLATTLSSGATLTTFFALGSPADVVTAHMQTASSSNPLTLRGAFRSVYVQHGIRGFYHGAGTAMIGTTFPIFAIALFPVSVGTNENK